MSEIFLQKNVTTCAEAPTFFVWFHTIDRKECVGEVNRKDDQWSLRLATDPIGAINATHQREVGPFPTEADACLAALCSLDAIEQAMSSPVAPSKKEDETRISHR